MLPPPDAMPAVMASGRALPPGDAAPAAAWVDFEDWLERYLQAAEPERAALEAEGRLLAAARRPYYKELIVRDPQQALMKAVPMVARQKLPPGIVALLEERIAVRGVLRQYWRAPEPGNEEPPVVRYVETEDGRTMQAFLYGRRAQEPGWVMNASLNGVAIDGQFAVNESPLRRLERGEVADPRKKAVEVCPVSGLVTEAVPSGEPVTEWTPVVEAFDEVVYLCDGAHIVPYEQSLILGESATGGAQGFTGILPSAPTPSVGVVKVLCIPAMFADQGQVPASEATMLNMLKETGDFYQVTSYGRLTLQATVIPPVVLPRNQAWYKGKDTTDGYIKEIDGLGLEMAHAKEEARKLGYDWQDYHATIVRANGGARSPTSFGSVGGGNVWMRSDSISTCSHEIGHAFGLTHANFWQTNGSSIIGPGGNVEYGHNYDNMGSTSPPNGHWNVQAKNQVKWLPDEFSPAITRSGLYRIHAFDTARLEPGLRYGLRITKDANRSYWGEHRSLFTTNNWASNGLLLGWKWAANSGANLQLLDTTPGSPNDRTDAAISLGRTFSDLEAGIHITTLSVNPDTVPRSVDVQVNLGAYPGNRPPVVSLAASATVVPLNTPVTFMATVEDPDGDTLSYGWIWHDSTISPNQAEVTRTFTASGIYTLNCVVSDMKGGTAIRNAVITVGTGGGRFTISGRITKEGAGLQGINVSTSGTNGTLTDSDGFFTISNLVAGTYTVTPAQHGSVFNELFNNTVTVGPSFSGADFTVDELPVVNISAPDPLAGESGDPGVFRISRTGSTALPMTVYVFPVQGTATKTTDYTFSPDYVAVTNTPWQTFTIPADADFLDVTLSPVNDSTEEGYETVTLVLGQDASFSPGSSLAATIGIVDDAAIPRVSLSINRDQINEQEAEPVLCTVTRTGGTAGSLDVSLIVAETSTATAGADYQSLPGTVTIPEGADSATFEVNSVNDALSEVTETLRITIFTNAAFVADSAANQVMLSIVDDDTQVVTLTAADEVATEVDLTQPGAVPDPGTFLLTRSGDISAPLTVYYSAAGSALHGTDYEALAGRVEFAAGETRAAVSILPFMDGFGEAPETVVLSLAAGNGNYLLGDDYSGTVTLRDLGGAPVLEVAASSVLAAEPSTNGTFRITAKGAGTGSLTVRYTISGSATAGVDYNISGLNTSTLEGSTTVTLNNATATQDITVTVLNDAALEEMETVVLTLLPDPAYSLWGPKSSTTLLLRDDDQPTVFVDPQVGNTGAHFVAESATGTACDFWISRTGSTASELTVNYSMTGTATNGADYTLLSGVAVIPAGAPGIDVTLNTVNDSLFEGTETAILHLEPGSYARGPDARLYITDNESGGPAVSFTSSGGSGLESLTEVGIPVTLSAAAAEPVTVEYSLEAGARIPTVLAGQWLRIVKTGTSFETFLSRDGTSFTKISSTRILSDFPTSYLAGLVVSSASTTIPAAVEFDQVSITGLSVGGSAGARVSADLAGSSPPGVTAESGGQYRVVAGGPDLALNGTTDGGHMAYFPISNSANCTVTARILNITTTSGSVRPGVIIRENMNTNSRRFAYIADTNGHTRQIYRTSTGGASTSALVQNTFTKPRWLRLQREGEVIRTFTSTNGSTFAPHGSGLTVPLGSNVLVGLAASARSDGLLTQAYFDNVSLTPAPAQPLQGRALGYVNEPGGVKQNGGTYVITASGNGIMPALSSTEDEGHFLSAPVSGDFTLTARVINIAGGGITPQAGLMVRDSINRRGRTVYFGLTSFANSVLDYRARLSSTTSGEGSGIDYTLPAGVLTFAPGETEKTIPLEITNDSIAEPDETVNVLLSYPHRAMLGTPATYTYTVMDDDGPMTPLPVIGFASAVSSGREDESPASIPVILSRASAEVVTVLYATTAGGTASATTDYTPISDTLTFQPGETVKVISLPILNDAVAEVDKTVSLVLSAPAGAMVSSTSAHTYTLQDDDLPVVTLEATDASATEGGDAGAFTFARTGSTASALTVQFSRSGSATSGADFAAFPSASSFTIPAGSASADLLVNTIQNTTPEIDETVILTLASGSGYVAGTPASATVIIQDDDVNTITLVATDGVASEAGSDAGELLLIRTGPLTATRQVNLSITGTATSGGDYTAIGGSRTFGIGESSIVIPVTALQDELTEGDEVVVVSITASVNYITGSPSVANVSIVDDDLPPSVFISSPASKATIIAEGNGLLLEATGMDDGLPSPLTYTWSRLFGPGTVTFENAAAASTGVTFSTPGVHGIRITVDDGQFTASDVIFVESGGFAYANWVSQDQGPPSVRGVAGESDDGFTLVGSGTGYSGTNDSGHLLFRQLSGGSGDATLMVRLSSLSGPATRLAGITLRDTSWKGARRVNLVVDGSGTVQFRSRSTANAADTASTQAGSTLPLWLRLERVGSTLTTATAPDVDGTPGLWTEAGTTSAVSLGANVVAGMVVSSGASTPATSTAMFDHVSVTPAFSGPALHSEDIGNYSLPGSSSVNGNITTVNGIGTYDNGGHFRYQQVWGDCMITARLLTQTGATRGSQAGVGLRDTTDNGPHGFYGRTSIDGFQAHWRSVPAGTASTLQTGGAIGSWVRLVRKGNSISAFRASDAGGVPGAWAQVTGNLPAALSGPLLVGLVVDSNSTSLTGTGTFSGLTIEPLNTAPVLLAGAAPSGPDYLLTTSVTDDGKPNPPGAYSLAWSTLSVPDQVIFSQPTAPVSLATPTRSGDYAVRLTADDGDARTYLDIAFAATIPTYQTWLHEHQLFAHPLAAEMDDADHDGLLNILEYAMNLPGNIPGSSPVSYDWAEVEGGQYLRISIPKNPAATNMRFEAQATRDVGSPASWSGDGLVIEADTPTLLRVRDHVPLSDGGRRFMRVRVWMVP